MTAKTSRHEQPREGGSYVRHTDGKLKRVEFTEHAAAPGEPAPAVATPAEKEA